MALSAGARLGVYEIRGSLGAGGMGVVYRAWDTRLRREVALKLLGPTAQTARGGEPWPEVAGVDPTARARFLHEARAAASLNHPHICTIHEVGDEDGVPFIAMELVAGETLQAIARRGPLTAERVCRLGRQLADALEHAHAHGIVHRDFKSANVIVTPDGRAKVLDFGIARRALAPASDATRTETMADASGTVSGTLAYLAPELLQGHPAGVQSDIWALGVVIYEMIRGRRPFAGATASELTAAILRDPVLPLPAGTPAGLARVVARCLAKEPADRPAHAGEVSLGLEVADTSAVVAPAAAGRRRGAPVAALAVAAIIAVAGAAGLIAWRSWSAPAALANKVEAIAVLPFENLSRDPEQEFFSDGMTDALITDLGKISALRVISRGSVMQYKARPKPPADVARELDVDAIVQGAVLRAGDRVRITAQLIDPSDGRLLWSDRYERDLSDVLALQSEIASAVAGQVRASIAPEESSRLRATRRVDPKAHELYLLGRHHTYRMNREGLTKAVDYLLEARRIDPDFALAHAGLAEAYYWSELWAGFGLGALHKEMRTAAEGALALDDSLAEAHCAMAQILSNREWNWAAADAEFRRAIELTPSLAEAHAGYAFYLQALGRHDDALEAAGRATALEPLSPYQLAQEGRVLYRARQYEKALQRYSRALEIDPSYPPALSRMSDVYLALGRFAEAEAYVKQLQHVSGQFEWRQTAQLYAMTGRSREARALIDKVEAESVTGSDVAWVLVALGDYDAALDRLERSVRERQIQPFALRDPRLDPIAASPRFHAILRSVNLEP